MAKLATWFFHITDNGGGHHNFTIKAASKQEAIDKGFARAKKKAKGDLSAHWDCRLVSA